MFTIHHSLFIVLPLTPLPLDPLNPVFIMERALFVSKSKNLKYHIPEFTRLYFGNEFCERLLPSNQEINTALAFAIKKGLRFTLVTPYCTERGLKRVKVLLKKISQEKPGSEVVINDWGVLRVLKNSSYDLIPVLGRLLTKIKRGPRLMNMLDVLPGEAIEYLKSSNLTVPLYAEFLKKNGIERVELDNPLQGFDFEQADKGIHLSLYIPFAFITTTRFCLTASCDIPEEKGLIGVFPCKKECQKYTFYLENPVMPVMLIRKGNTVFFKNDKIPAGLKEKGVDRIVIQPEVPV